MNKLLFYILILLFTFNISCNTSFEKKEKYLFHDTLKAKIKELSQQKTPLKIYIKKEGKRDTLSPSIVDWNKQLELLLKYGISEGETTTYTEKKYQNKDYLITELTTNDEDKIVKKLRFKENSKGEFNYLIQIVKNNRLMTLTHEMEFNSSGNFLIQSKQQVSMSYVVNYRVEGKTNQ